MVSSALSVTLCTQALVMIGADPITSLDDDTRESIVANALYQPLADAALCSYPWRFAMKQRELARVADPPLGRHDYGYQIPSDCLMVRAVTVLDRPIDYEIYNDLVYASRGETDELIIDYLFRADETIWPPLFRLGLTYDLAAAFCVSLAEDEKKQGQFLGQAQLTWQRARVADAQSRTARKAYRSRLLGARHT